MVVSRSRTIALDYGDLTLGGAELAKLNSLRILGGNFKVDVWLICGKLRQRQSGAWVSCSNQESYLIVHVCSRAVSMQDHG